MILMLTDKCRWRTLALHGECENYTKLELEDKKTKKYFSIEIGPNVES